MTPAELLAKQMGKLEPPKMKEGPGNANRRPPMWFCLVRAKRKALRLTLMEVAEHLGISHNTLADIEAGHDAGLMTCYKLAKFFGCNIEDVWSPKEQHHVK